MPKARAKPRASPTRRQIEAIADQLCALVDELTRHRGGSGPHWIGVDTIEHSMRRHGVAVHHDDLQAAVAIAVKRCVLKTEGNPPHSVSRFEEPGKWLRPQKRTPPIKERRRKR
jgi:hypothetical protein